MLVVSTSILGKNSSKDKGLCYHSGCYLKPCGKRVVACLLVGGDMYDMHPRWQLSSRHATVLLKLTWQIRLWAQWGALRLCLYYKVLWRNRSRFRKMNGWCCELCTTHFFRGVARGEDHFAVALVWSHELNADQQLEHIWWVPGALHLI